MGLAAVAVLVLAAGGYYLATSRPSAPVVAVSPAVGVVQEKAVQTVPDDQRQRDQAELARLRAEAAAREKAEQELAAKRQSEEEIRRKIAAETVEKKRLEEEAKQKADAEAEAAARRRAEEDERNGLAADEAALQLGKVDRQHIQVALVALGYGVSLMDGTLDRAARDKIAAWQKARKEAATGFLTGLQYQALLQEAASAISKFDDEQKKFEEERKKAATGNVPVNPDIAPLEATGGSSCIWHKGRIAEQPQSTSAGSSPIGWTFSFGVAGTRSRPTRPAILPEAFQAPRAANSRCW